MMKMIARTMVVALVAMGMLAMETVAKAGVVTGPPFAGFTTGDSSKDLDIAGGPFSVDLSSNTNFLSQVHTIVGFAGSAGMADIQHESYTGSAGFFGNIDSAYAMVGRNANGDQGGFAYLFVLSSGVTAGHTVTADVYFNGTPDTQGLLSRIGVVSGGLQIGGALQDFSPTVYFDQENARDLFGANTTSGNYNGTVTLTIPDGLTEFYVTVEDAGTSGRLAILNLTVSAIPEPSSFVLLGSFGLLGLVGGARRRK